jgi:hypothetical protein
VRFNRRHTMVHARNDDSPLFNMQNFSKTAAVVRLDGFLAPRFVDNRTFFDQSG